MEFIDFIAIHGWGGQWTMATQLMLRVLPIRAYRRILSGVKGREINKMILYWRRFDDTISFVSFFLIPIIKIVRKNISISQTFS